MRPLNRIGSRIGAAIRSAYSQTDLSYIYIFHAISNEDVGGEIGAVLALALWLGKVTRVDGVALRGERGTTTFVTPSERVEITVIGARTPPTTVTVTGTGTPTLSVTGTGTPTLCVTGMGAGTLCVTGIGTGTRCVTTVSLF